MVVINSIRKENVYIKAQKGDTFSPLLEFLDVDEAPLDLSPYTFRMQIRDEKGTLYLTWVEGTHFTVTDNTIQFNAIVDLVAGTYYTDMQGTHTDNSITTFFGGKFEVIDEQTRNA